MLKFKILLGFFLVGHGVHEKDEVFGGQVLAIIGVSFEENSQPVSRKDCFEQVEVFAKHEEVLNIEFTCPKFPKLM